MMGGNCKCSFKNWLWASLVVAAFFLGLDMFFHEYCMKNIYAANTQYFRAPEAMAALRWWGFLGYFVFGLLFTCIYSKGYDPAKGKVGQGIRYGILLGLLYWGANFLIAYPYMPLPNQIYLNWFGIGMVEFLILGIAVGLLYKPKTA